VTTVAGTGVAGFGGDGKVTPDGTIATIAGSGASIPNILVPPSFLTCEFAGDGVAATSATLCIPAQLAFDSSGSLYFADFGNARVRRISPQGTITTVAGNGQRVPAGLTGNGLGYSPAGPFSSGDGGPAIHATFNRLGAIATDTTGNLYVSDSRGNRIRKIGSDGVVRTFAGTGQPGYSGDGGPALEASFFGVGPLSLDSNGDLYVVTADSRVRKITQAGIIQLVAGTGTGTGLDRAQGDGGPAINATLNEPGGVAFDGKGNTYIADTSNARLRKVDSSGIITTIVGPGQQGTDYYNAVAIDPQGNVFLAWTRAMLFPAVAVNAISGMVMRVNPDGSLTRVVGNGQPCTGGPGGAQFAFDGRPALEAQLCEVRSMTIDKNGVMYLAYGSQILSVTPDGIIHTVAGNALATAAGDGGPVIDAGLQNAQGGPGAPAFDPSGNMLIPETGVDRVRMVTSTPYKLTVSVDSISAPGSQPITQRIETSANFLEPFPYAVRVSTESGGSWLSVNRSTGLVGEPIAVTANPVGLAPGTYRGTVSIATEGGVSQQVTVPVTLVAPQVSR
jgi:sugar lactone lactonase YvrE